VASAADNVHLRMADPSGARANGADQPLVEWLRRK
jgi:hypothetical protein